MHDDAPALGYGLATLMREPSRKRREYLLDAAYDLGYRHLDVAPLYGLGAAEPELGRWLAKGDRHPVVATKVGLAPSRLARVAALGQAPLRSALRRSPMLTKLARASSPGAAAPAVLSGEAVKQGVQASLMRLGVEHLDYLLLHEVEPGRISEDTFTAVAGLVGDGLVRRFGVSGPPSVVFAGDLDERRIIRVVQTSGGLFFPQDRIREGIKVVHYGVLNDNLKRFSDLMADDGTRTRFEELTARPLRTINDLAAALVVLAATSRQGSTVLVGSTDADHLTTIAREFQRERPPAEQLAAARELLRSAHSRP